MMLVVGNGESRGSIQITCLNYTTIGCNAIYRDFKVDHLVCVDKPMLREVIEAQYHYDTKVYTRKNLFEQHKLEKNIRIIPNLPYAGSERPDDPVHWGSGPYAVLLAAKLATDDIHLLGFDLYSTDNKVNNIYKDTANYALAHKSAVDPTYWIYQIGKVFEHFSNTRFIVHQTDNWQLPKSWKYPNVKVDTISNL
jgi:hypothetical protein